MRISKDAALLGRVLIEFLTLCAFVNLRKFHEDENQADKQCENA